MLQINHRTVIACIKVIGLAFSTALPLTEILLAEPINSSLEPAIAEENRQQVNNMPLYLSLIEFDQVEVSEQEKVKPKEWDRRRIEPKGKLSLKSFHQRNAETLSDKMSQSADSFCRACHLPLPHQKNIRSRTFNNMHSRFIACESCHFKSDLLRQKNISFKWFDLKRRSTIKAQQNPFRPGTFKSNLTKNPQSLSEKLLGTAIKISPFWGNQAAIITKQHLYVERLMLDWKQADIARQAALKVKIHNPLRENGAICQDCHTAESLLDLADLGADIERQKAYQSHIIAKFFKHYSYSVQPPLGQSRKKAEMERIRIIELLP